MAKAKRHYQRTRRKRDSAGANTPPGFVRSSTGNIPGTVGPLLGAMTVAQFPILQFGDPGEHAVMMASKAQATAYEADSEESRDMGMHAVLPKRRKRRTKRLKKYGKQPWSYEDKGMLALVSALERSTLGEKKALKASSLDTDIVKALGALSMGSKPPLTITKADGTMIPLRKRKKGKSKTMKSKTMKKKR